MLYVRNSLSQDDKATKKNAEVDLDRAQKDDSASQWYAASKVGMVEYGIFQCLDEIVIKVK